MYAITRKIGDEEADALISEFCTSDGRCVKTILWEITPGRPVRGLPVSKFDLEADQLDSPEKSLPLPCAEACNLLVAAARAVVRKNREPA